MNTQRIYVPLEGEDLEVWAPVDAVRLGEGRFELPASAPGDEDWRFKPGAVVICQRRNLSEGVELCAVREAQS